MPYFGLTSAFLLSPLFLKVCDLPRFRCAACSGLGVRLTPVYLCAMPRFLHSSTCRQFRAMRTTWSVPKPEYSSKRAFTSRVMSMPEGSWSPRYTMQIFFPARDLRARRLPISYMVELELYPLFAVMATSSSPATGSRTPLRASFSAMISTCHFCPAHLSI